MESMGQGGRESRLMFAGNSSRGRMDTHGLTKGIPFLTTCISIALFVRLLVRTYITKFTISTQRTWEEIELNPHCLLNSTSYHSSTSSQLCFCLSCLGAALCLLPSTYTTVPAAVHAAPSYRTVAMLVLASHITAALHMAVPVN